MRFLVVPVLLVALAGCSSSGGSTDGAAHAALSPTSPTATSPVPSATDRQGVAAASAGGSTLPAADRAAGLLSRSFPQHGSGRLVAVPGSAAAPGRGRVRTVKVQVEKGLKVDPKQFARFVMATLNDRRSWGHGGTMRFARVGGGDADIRVVLATPDTSARLCRPLVTYGKLSCRSGDAAVMTMYRWVRAIPGYGTDRTGYRHYLVDHEVGHVLGHGHEQCPGRGRRAPVMMQQTKGLGACTPNPWPHP